MTILGGNMSDNRSNNIGWFLAGLGLGVGAAILYAPKSGRETRKAIVTGADESREDVASVGRNAREHISTWVDSGKDVINRKGDPSTATGEKEHKAVHDSTAGEE